MKQTYSINTKAGIAYLTTKGHVKSARAYKRAFQITIGNLIEDFAMTSCAVSAARGC